MADAVEIEAAGLGAVDGTVDVHDERTVAVVEVVAAAGANHINEITTGATPETWTPRVARPRPWRPRVR